MSGSYQVPLFFLETPIGGYKVPKAVIERGFGAHSSLRGWGIGPSD